MSRTGDMTGKSPSMRCRPIFGRFRVKFLLLSNPTPKSDKTPLRFSGGADARIEGSRKAMPCNNPPCVAVDQGRREIAGAALPTVDQAQVTDVTRSIKNATQP